MYKKEGLKFKLLQHLKEEILKDFDEEYKKFLQCAKCDKVYDFSCPCQINRREFGKKLSLALDKQHKADMEEVIKIAEDMAGKTNAELESDGIDDGLGYFVALKSLINTLKEKV